MGWLLAFVLVPICVGVVRRRTARWENAVIPEAVIVYSIFAGLWTTKNVLGVWAAIAGVDPAEKGTLLAKALSVLLETEAFGIVVHVAVLVAAAVVDRLVRARAMR